MASVSVQEAPSKGGSVIAPGLEVIGQQAAPPGPYQFVGQRYTVLNVTLPPGGTFVSEAGAMMHMSTSVRMRAYLGGLMGAASSWLSGEDIVRVKYTNGDGSEPGYVGLTPNQPMAVLVPIDLEAVGGSINAKRGAYIAGPESVSARVKILPAASCLACCCGGMPPLIQSVSGAGVAFLSAGGTVVKKTLSPGESLLVDTESVVAFSNSITYDVRPVGSCLTCSCGGESCFNTELVGPGDVYVQSMSYEKLVKFLVSGGARGGGSKKKKDDDHGRGSPAAADHMLR